MQHNIIGSVCTAWKNSIAAHKKWKSYTAALVLCILSTGLLSAQTEAIGKVRWQFDTKG